MDRKRKIGMGMVLLGASLWGSSSNCIEFLMHRQMWSWQMVLFARMVCTSAVFLLWCLYKKMDMLAPFRENGMLLAKFVLLGLYIMQVAFTRGIEASNAATATVLQYLMPALLLAHYLLREHRLPRKKEVTAVGLAIIGTALIATKGRGAALAVSPEALFWGILSAFGMAWYTMYAADLLKKYSCFLILGWGSLGNALLLWIFHSPNFNGAVINGSSLLAFSGLLFLGTFIAYYVYLDSTRYIPASETGALAAFEPLSAYFFSIVFMGNHIGGAETLGALCIIAMVILLARK